MSDISERVKKIVVEHLGVEPDKVTRAVNALMELNYVRREQDKYDKRRVVLSLTPRSLAQPGRSCAGAPGGRPAQGSWCSTSGCTAVAPCSASRVAATVAVHPVRYVSSTSSRDGGTGPVTRSPASSACTRAMEAT